MSATQAVIASVRDGIAEGRQPFLEVHNPTDNAIKAAITSPAHTPVYFGTRLIVDVPAGSSVTVPVKPLNSVALLIAKSAHMPGLEAKSAYCLVTAPWKRFFLPLVRGLVVR